MPPKDFAHDLSAMTAVAQSRMPGSYSYVFTIERVYLVDSGLIEHTASIINTTASRANANERSNEGPAMVQYPVDYMHD